MSVGDVGEGEDEGFGSFFNVTGTSQSWQRLGFRLLWRWIQPSLSFGWRRWGRIFREIHLKAKCHSQRR